MAGQSRVHTLTLPRYIKQIGRGRHASDLSREDAKTLFEAMLAGAVPELELGGILIALRVKGESLAELAGFAAACEASYPHLAVPAVPVVIPSYNGARQLPNLVPLLALLLARDGMPVLVHGVVQDPGRVTTREVFEALGVMPARSGAEAIEQLSQRRVSFLPIEVLAPSIAGLLALRSRLGVRNSAHTLVKMLQPCVGPALRLVSVTHPDYLTRMREYFTRHDDGALLLRGAEGEAVAHVRREPSIDWAFRTRLEHWPGESAGVQPDARDETLDLPEKSAGATARWIEEVLAGKRAVPAAIAHQVDACKRALDQMSSRGVGNGDEAIPTRSKSHSHATRDRHADLASAS